MRRLEVLASNTLPAWELGEGIERQLLGTQLGLDRIYEVDAHWAQVAAADVGVEHREECAAMREQQTLATIDLEQVQIPVTVGRVELDERHLLPAQQVEHLLRAAHDHRPQTLPATIGDRMRALIVVLWRGGLRIQDALSLSERDLEPTTRLSAAPAPAPRPKQRRRQRRRWLPLAMGKQAPRLCNW